MATGETSKRRLSVGGLGGSAMGGDVIAEYMALRSTPQLWWSVTPCCLMG